MIVTILYQNGLQAQDMMGILLILTLNSKMWVAIILTTIIIYRQHLRVSVQAGMEKTWEFIQMVTIVNLLEAGLGTRGLRGI